MMATHRRTNGRTPLDVLATGGAVDAGTDRILERIRKLLALAGSSNQNEAEIAMRKAHELMLRHNIEVKAVREERNYEVRHLGDPSKRSTSVETAIAGVLLDFFFVQVVRVPVYLPLVGKMGQVFEIVGTHANVEMGATSTPSCSRPPSGCGETTAATPVCAVVATGSPINQG